MNKNSKKKKMDFKCYMCKTRYNLDELKGLGYIEKVAEYITVECPNCGNQDSWKK